ncbi:hypothetical protein BT93_E0776 [Corymbia citriodora subsp. variegata]|nr:hypothetical protein BT93_E0776 [Corymbia citriodora subsp. variegata]
MAFEDERFDRSGPQGLNRIDWKNADHVRSVVASLVHGVSILERDRQEKRYRPLALAPPWWETFGFQLESPLKDKANSSIFGAIFEYERPSSSGNRSADGPRFVVAFRGTLIKAKSTPRDMKLNAQIIMHKLHSSSRCETAMQAVEKLVAAPVDSRIWLAGHSQGSAIALHVGKNMAKKRLLESFLFNPPFVSAPLEKIKSWRMKLGLQLFTSVLRGVVALVKHSRERRQQYARSFAALSPWVPHLFVNKVDLVCSGYIGYFEFGNWMQQVGLGDLHKFARQYSVMSMLLSKKGTQAEPLHLIPSAKLTINSAPLECCVRAHGICEWWKQDLRPKSIVYEYEY